MDHLLHLAITKVAESEEIMGHKMHDFLVDFFAERNFQESTESVAVATTHKEWKIRSVSCKKKYHSIYQQHKKVFSSLEDVLCGKMSTTDLVLLTPNLSPSCPKCSSQCISQTTQALSFLKKQT